MTSIVTFTASRHELLFDNRLLSSHRTGTKCKKKMIIGEKKQDSLGFLKGSHLFFVVYLNTPDHTLQCHCHQHRVPLHSKAKHFHDKGRNSLVALLSPLAEHHTGTEYLWHKFDCVEDWSPPIPREKRVHWWWKFRRNDANSTWLRRIVLLRCNAPWIWMELKERSNVVSTLIKRIR